MAHATFTSKDQNWIEESTVYWFSLEGDDHNSGKNFEGDVFGVRECGPDSQIVDSDGATVNYNDSLRNCVQRLCVVTDAMRAA
jgi:hypothetical protein